MIVRPHRSALTFFALGAIAPGHGTSGSVINRKEGDPSKATLGLNQGFDKLRRGDAQGLFPSSSSDLPTNGTNSLWNGIFDHRHDTSNAGANALVTHDKDQVGKSTSSSRGDFHDIIKKRILFDEGLSSWDGWKIIQPSTSPGFCLDHSMGQIVACSDVSSDDYRFLWKHDNKGRLVTKYGSSQFCFAIILDGTTPILRTSVCNDSDAQVWTRTASGQFRNKQFSSKVLAKEDCSSNETNIALDENGVSEDGCDLFSVVGPNVYDPLDFGSIYFHKLGQDLAPTIDDHLFGSSVSIDDNGDTIVVGGSSLDSDNFLSRLTIYKLSDNNSWTEKASFELNDHPSVVKPKVSVTISGDANRVALAIASTSDNGAIQVLDYDGDFSLTPVGAPIDGESSGELPGLKLAMDKNGRTLVVGSPYYNNGTVKDTGRVRIFDILLETLSTNIATSGTATQSSNYMSYTGPEKAINGITDGIFENRGVSRTHTNNNPWWQLKFQSSNLISGVRVYSREEACGICHDHIKGFVLKIFNGQTVVYDSSLEDPSISQTYKEVYVFDIPPNVTGDKVSIKIHKNNVILSMAEVEVYGEETLIPTTSLKATFDGENENDRAGNAVSISNSGDLIAYGQTGHDNDGNADSGSAGLLKLESGTWSKFGVSIYGEKAKDETGFSVKVVYLSDTDKIRLALGAILNDGNNQVNSGHVRVYDCNFDTCDAWTQVGSDIDGDNGVVVDGDSFHVGDAFGFSLDMSDNGDRLVVGAPFHSASRESDYYSGSVKLFEFGSTDWEQLGHDMIGDGNGETSGYSVGLSKDGMTVVVGSPVDDDDSSGSVQVYLQDDVSNAPSTEPSAAPSSEPSSEPSSVPSRMPSGTPSDSPTTTSQPSALPSIVPSAAPSLQPSSKPSSLPSSVPSISAPPSSAPTVTFGRPFQIRSSYERFSKVTGTDQSWCLQAFSRAPLSKLNMRPCDGSKLQTWILDENGMIVLKDYPGQAIDFEARILWTNGKNIANSANKKFVMDMSENSISVTRTNKKFYVGIDVSKIFSRLRLFKEGDDNESLYSWHIEYFGPSDMPSISPTITSSPSRMASPSMTPSTIPSLGPSEVSPIPQCAQSSCGWQKLGSNIDGSTGNIMQTDIGFASDGTRLAYGERGYDGEKGRVRVFDYIGSTWTIVGSEVVGETNGEGFYRCNLSGDGKTFVAGSTWFSGNRGKVTVHRLVDGQWQKLGGDLVGENTSDIFSYGAISYDGSRIVASSPANSNGRGHAKVYDYVGTAWSKVGNTWAGQNEGDHFGGECDISDDGGRIICGGPDASSKAGYAEVIEVVGNSWTILQRFNGDTADENCGARNAISGDGSRAAYGCVEGGKVFVKDLATFQTVGSVIKGDAFGRGIDLSEDGSAVVIASPHVDHNSEVNAGAIQVYNYANNDWVSVTAGKIYGEAAGDLEGFEARISADGMSVITSSGFHDNKKGHVRAFTLINTN